MIKARNKKLSMILVVAMLMTMFAGLGTAGAASTTYSAVTTPTFSSGVTDPAALGIIEVKLDNAAGVQVYDMLTISLPSSVTINAGTISTTANNPGDAVFVEVPATIPGTTVTNAFSAANITPRIGGTRQSVDITFNTNGTTGQGILYVRVLNAKVEATEDLSAIIMGSNSAVFPMQPLVIGKIQAGSGGTNLTAKSQKTIGSGGGNLDILTLIETKTNTLKSGNVIKLKLPNGFGWTTYDHPTFGALAPFATPTWAFTGYTTVANGDIVVARSTSDPRTLTVTMGAAAGTNPARATAGRIDLAAGIEILDDSLAKLGEVAVNISGDNVTDQDVPVAKYADYGVTVEEGTVKDVVAGWDQKEIAASFKIVEGMAGSLINNRVVSLTLPEGVKWNTNAATGAWPNVVGGPAPLVVENETGSVTLGAAAGSNATAGLASTNNGRTIKLRVTTGTKSTMLLKKFQLSIRPDFVGELKIDVAGDAGVTGSVKIANVTKGMALESDGQAKIIIGAQGQAAGDILLKESAREVIDTTTAGYLGAANNKMIVLRLPEGASWSVKPAVTVSEGDASIDTVNTDARDLKITFKSSSTKASTIKISDVKVTTNRVVPEGDFKVSIVGEAGTNNVQSMAITNNVASAQFNLSTIDSVVIGKCVTPAPSQGTSGAAAGQFRIDSNIYEVNGVAKVMDATPYIKAGRTYVPVRYLGMALGVAESDIVWDEATQNVTLTLGDKKVEMTIGSTTITVNGEAQTMDVAPEINNGRTMLPARYVAEGLGYSVGWDAATRTVLVSK